MNESLTADELAAIKERHGKLGHGPIESFSYPIQDRARLLAEVERLQAQLATAWDEGFNAAFWNLAESKAGYRVTIANPYRPVPAD